jgi:hypothetical protein
MTTPKKTAKVQNNYFSLFDFILLVKCITHG